MKYLKLAGATILLPLLVIGCMQDEDPQGVLTQSQKDALKNAAQVEDKLKGAAETQLQKLEQGNQ